MRSRSIGYAVVVLSVFAAAAPPLSAQATPAGASLPAARGGQDIPRPFERQETAAAAAAADVAAADAAATARLSGIVQGIVRDNESAYDRARAIYQWIAEYVEYDVAGYLSGETGDMSAVATFRRGSAVCEGFANLFVHMAGEAGVRAEKIVGYAKGFDYTRTTNTRNANHAWVAFHAGGAWRLADPTWGAGHVRDRQFERSFTWWFFDVDPAALALSHHPEQSRWQLVSRPLSRRDFERLAVVPRTLFEAGLSSEALRNAARTSSHGFPLVNAVPGARLVSVPLTQVLQSGAPTRFEIAWPAADAVMVTWGGHWVPMQRAADSFVIDVVPGSGPLMVVGRLTGETGFRTLVYYDVR
jgi:hypothetical protein